VVDGPKHAFCRVCGAHAPDANLRKTVYIVPAGILDEPLLVSTSLLDPVLGADGAARFNAGSLGTPNVLDQQA